MPIMTTGDADQEVFRKLKECCVPLLGNAGLNPTTIPKVLELLTQLAQSLRDIQERKALRLSLITYVFFPIGTILRRNAPTAIPDQVLERVFAVLALLCDQWWWDMDVKTWEQIFMLSGAVLAGFDAKGKGRDRADETKEAAIQCLWVLMHPRRPEDDPAGAQGLFDRPTAVFTRFLNHAQSQAFLPVLGQTVNSVLVCTEASDPSLQKASLRLLQVVAQEYLPDNFVPSVLPGIISSMCKVALGSGLSKTWANGGTVAAALVIIQKITVRAIGDEICIQEGAVTGVQDLEDLLALTTKPDRRPQENLGKYATARTPSWLHGSASQLHMALNSLNSLVLHPSPTALHALSCLSATLLRSTTLTLPQSQPLLVTFLLSLSSSELEAVASDASLSLSHLLEAPTTQATILPVLLQILKDYLASLPRLLSSRSDAKVEHVAKVVAGICRLVKPYDGQEIHSGTAVSAGIAKLLGPSGGIERWGWGLLAVLEMSTPTITAASAYTARLMLEADTAEATWHPFPEVNFTLLTSRSAQEHVETMFRELGAAVGDGCLYAAEWFFEVGRGRSDSRAVAALWCGCRLLGGAGDVSLSRPVVPYTLPRNRSRKAVEKYARGLVKQLSEMWDQDDVQTPPMEPRDGPQDGENVVLEHLSGIVTVRTPYEVAQNVSPQQAGRRPAPFQPELQKAFALEALAVSAGILQSKFSPLLLHSLYPVLHSLVAKSSHLSSTALATLHYFTQATSHASPANLLLSNFDYALDSVSRHLSRRWLDADAATVLAILVRLVGRDVVSKAGDVVEECFDRLDEYHGYETLVNGLIAVLGEVVDVIGQDENNQLEPKPAPTTTGTVQTDAFSDLLRWLDQRKLPPEEEVKEDPGPVPREDWGTHGKEQGKDEGQAPDPTNDTPPTPTQALVKQIVSRSLYFLTHGSPTIRAHILTLLARAVPVLPESALLPSIHHAWPYILNRFNDRESFVLSAAAALVEALANQVGDFMNRRIWNDIWPRFRSMIVDLNKADAASTLARRSGTVGTESAYTHSHRLYRSILKTMTAAAKSVQADDNACWDVTITFRRFLHKHVQEELQACARDLYKAMMRGNEDAVWFALSATQGEIDAWPFLQEEKWSIEENVSMIFAS